MTPSVSEPPKIHYTHPKIMLINCYHYLTKPLREIGFSITYGSFGSPYNMKVTGEYERLVSNGSLPEYYIEQQIVIIDLNYNSLYTVNISDEKPLPNQNGWFIRCLSKKVDPRPAFMFDYGSYLQTIFMHGGILIVFADSPLDQEIVFGRKVYTGKVEIDYSLPHEKWFFLDSLSFLKYNQTIGTEYSFISDNRLINKIFTKYDLRGEYRSVLSVNSQEPNWNAIALNKYKQTVAGYIQSIPIENEPNGYAFILPQIEDKIGFLVSFIKDDLPNLAPHLFPEFEKLSWVFRDEYEIEEVTNNKKLIIDITTKLKENIAEMNDTIDKIRIEKGYLYELLEGTGRELLEAVLKALNIVGFKNVIDVDMLVGSGDGNKREDLRIEEQDKPLLLVEVKGINSLPKEDDGLAVFRYITPKIKELNTTSVRGLSIINHQRHLPPLERDNSHVFQIDTITNAQTNDIGLMTTFDLYKLVRSYLRNNWSSDTIIPLFYQSGRIAPLPTHYEYAGEVDHYYAVPKAVIIKLTNSPLHIADRIAFDAGTVFEEQTVESLRLNDQDVNEVPIEEEAGILSPFSKELLKPGTKVYLVHSNRSEG